MTTPSRFPLAALLGLGLVVTPIAAQSLGGENLGFDDAPPGEGVPAGWDGRGALPLSGGLGYRIDVVGDDPRSAPHCMRLIWEGPGREEGPDFGALTQGIDAARWHGRRVRLSGWLRTDDVESGAGLWMRVDGDGGLLAFDNMSDRFVRGDTDWERYEVVHDVDDRAEQLVFGVLLTGRGTVWADDMRLEIVGDDVEPTTLFINEPFEDTPADRLVVDWITRSAVKLERSDPLQPSSQLLPFVRRIDAQVVGLGQAANGTREQHQLRQRLVRALIEERGADVIALDIDWATALYLDQWVRRGRGDPRAELAALHDWTWRYEEVLDLLVWLRDWNRGADPERRVRLAGINGRRVDSSLALALSFLERVSDGPAAELEAVLQPLAAAETERRPAADTELEKAAYTIEHVLEAFDTNREAWSEETSDKAWSRARHLVEVTGQAVEIKRSHEQAAWADAKARATNVDWLIEQAGEDARIVLLAHNESVALKGELEFPTLGQELRKRLGDDYLSVGGSFDHGVFRARDGRTLELRTYEVPTSPPGSVGHTLTRVHDGPVVIDLRTAPPAGPARSWLAEPHQLRCIGSWYSEHARDLFVRPMLLPEHFDALMHVPEVTLATPLDTP